MYTIGIYTRIIHTSFFGRRFNNASKLKLSFFAVELLDSALSIYVFGYESFQELSDLDETVDACLCSVSTLL